MSRDYEDLGGRDPWEILGLRPGADRNEIRRAHRQRTRTGHTDVGGDHKTQSRLNIARDVLLDPGRLRDFEERRREQTRSREPQAGAAPTVPPTRERMPDDPYEWVSGTGGSHRDQPLYPQYRPGGAYRDQATDPNHRTYPTYPTYPNYNAYAPPPQPYRSSPRAWNGLAIASLVTSLICWPVGALMAVVALAQIRRTGARGAPLAWVAIAVSALAAVVICAQVLIPASRT